jgi:ABC-type thiamine transport system ATPase subunit
VSVLELSAVYSPLLKSVSGSFGPGIHVWLGAESDGTAELIELCAGVRLPRRGRLQLDGEPPGSSPNARRNIASLLPSEDDGLSGRVASWVAQLSALRGFDASAAVRRYCPQLELERTLASLSHLERRQLALAGALGQPEPKLVALHEPLSAAGSEGSLVVERVQQLAERAPVLLTTRSAEDARRVGGQLLVLERGVLVRETRDAWPSAVTPGLRVELWLTCDAPRRLLAELLSSPEVERASFDSQQGGRIQVVGADLERLALAVSRAALAARVELRSLRAGSPDLAAVHGASAGLAQAAYRAAQTARRGGP